MTRKIIFDKRLESLGGRIEDLATIEKTDKDTEELFICGSKFFDIEFLKEFKNLKYLKMLGMNKIKDLTPLKYLENLTHLKIMTWPSWDGSGKRIYYETLEPISSLNQLEYLWATDIEFLNDGLKPLYKIKSLKNFISMNNYTTEDFALLAYYRPDIECIYACAYRELEFEYCLCKKCGTYKIEFSGKEIPRKIFCKNCNKNKVRELTERYNEIIKNIK